MSMTAQEKAALAVVVAVGQAIKDLKSVPSGHLYVRLMGQMSLETYKKVIGILVRAGAVREENHTLTWVGE